MLLVVALVVVAAGRQPVLVTSAAVTPVSSSTVELGVITSGDATVAKKPDVAFISVGVESQQSTASAAQSDLANKAAKLIARAKVLGIADKDINTSGYSVGPYYANGSQTINGYRAAEQLSLKWHTVDTVGKTLDALVQEGGATNIGVGFGLADPKAAQAEARTLAIGDAHARRRWPRRPASSSARCCESVTLRFRAIPRRDTTSSRPRRPRRRYRLASSM